MKEDIISKIQKLSDKNYPNSEVYLFGSQTRGNATKYSDYDLLVLLNSDEIPFNLETKIMDDFYDIELETGQIISPLIYTKKDWDNKYNVTPIYESVKKDGFRIK
jgi:predicted nucleotidyltransferase